MVNGYHVSMNTDILTQQCPFTHYMVNAVQIHG